MTSHMRLALALAVLIVAVEYKAWGAGDALTTVATVAVILGVRRAWLRRRKGGGS